MKIKCFRKTDDVHSYQKQLTKTSYLLNLLITLFFHMIIKDDKDDKDENNFTS